MKNIDICQDFFGIYLVIKLLLNRNALLDYDILVLRIIPQNGFWVKNLNFV